MGSILEAECRPSSEGTTPNSPIHQERLQDKRDRMRGTHAPGAKPATTAGTQETATADNPLQDCEGPHPRHAPENILTPADRSRRRIRPTTFRDCRYDNTIARHEIRNTCGLKIPDSKTEQYKNSFFVRTVADWNKLEDTIVTVDSVTAFSSAVGRVPQEAAPHT